MGIRDFLDLIENRERGLSSGGMRMLGLMLIVVGLLVTTIALFPKSMDIDGIIIFPFVFRNLSQDTVIFIAILSFAFFVFSSILPWYLLSRRRNLANEVMNFGRRVPLREGDSNTIEYIITTELPRSLRKSIYIEEADGAINLMSFEEQNFFRSYTLPKGFELNGIDYDYEGNYLVLKLILRRSTSF